MVQQTGLMKGPTFKAWTSVYPFLKKLCAFHRKTMLKKLNFSDTLTLNKADCTVIKQFS